MFEDGSHRIRKGGGPLGPMRLLLGLAVVGLIAAALWFGHPSPTPAPESPVPPVYPPGTQRATMTLYFASPDGLYLVPEARQVLQPPELTDRMAEVVRELIAGPDSERLARTLPAETTLRQVFLTERGVAYVDLGPEIAAQHPSGAGAELLSVYSIVDSLQHNFPQVREVAILIDGHERDTLAGHVEIASPLLPRTDFIAERAPAGQKG